MHDAVRYNSTLCIRMLLRFAPHLLDAVNHVGINNVSYTPLMIAVRYDKIEAAKMLLRAGADVRTKDRNDRTLFDYACNNKEMLKILKQHQQVSGIFYSFKIMKEVLVH